MNEHSLAILPYLNEYPKAVLKNINVVLTDLTGHILIEEINKNLIDIASLPKGYYIAFVFDCCGILIKKIRVVKK